jgi:hypothetical protein
MSDPDQLIRLVNRALRLLDEIAGTVIRSNLQERDAATKASVNSLDSMMRLQEFLVSEFPDLDYHYDSNKPPTLFMTAITQLIVEADSYEKKGKIADAIRVLEIASSLEPPPLPYEVLSKRLLALRKRSVISG